MKNPGKRRQLLLKTERILEQLDRKAFGLQLVR
jgi:hypothetical protein